MKRYIKSSTRPELRKVFDESFGGYVLVDTAGNVWEFLDEDDDDIDSDILYDAQTRDAEYGWDHGYDLDDDRY